MRRVACAVAPRRAVFSFRHWFIFKRSGARILSELRTSQCTLSPKAQHGDAFLLHEGVYYRHDVRVQMMRNTLEAPTSLSAASAHSRSACPNVKKTFLNAHTCVRRETCAAPAFSSVPIELNHSTLRRFHSVAKHIVVAIAGLRLEKDQARARHLPLGTGYT